MDTSVAIFFHGLNTFKDDLLHLGPVNLGRFDRHLKPALESRGVRVYSIDGIGFDSPEAQAQTAAREIAKLDFQNQRVNFLGNSMGGLTARALARLWATEPDTNPQRLEIEKLISWGAPHFGTSAATWSVTKGHSTFRHYSPQAMVEFNKRCPLDKYAREYYFLCATNWRGVSPYFWSLYPLLHGLKPKSTAPSDGFILAESQAWGEHRGSFTLDHFGQIGFDSILPLRHQRANSQREFAKLCDGMVELIAEIT